MSAKQIVPEITVGLDLGDRKSALCRLNEAGDVVDRRVVPITPANAGALLRGSSARPGCPRGRDPLSLDQPLEHSTRARGDRRQPGENPEEEDASEERQDRC